jgi:hypothetical protein
MYFAGGGERKKKLNNSTSAGNITEKKAQKFVQKISCINNAMYKNTQQSRKMSMVSVMQIS